MQMLGFAEYNDLLFVFSAGLSELTFGILILLGIGTRFVILSVSCFFLLTSVLLGLHELVGHVPIVACCLVLFSLGGGESIFKLISKGSTSVVTPLPVGSVEK